MFDQYGPILKKGDIAKILKVSIDTVKRIARRDPNFPRSINPNPRGEWWIFKDDFIAWLHQLRLR